MKYNKQALPLAMAIQSALDCQNHFKKPNLRKAWVDKDFIVDFDKSIVLCDQCVERFRHLLGLKENQHPLDAPGLKR